MALGAAASARAQQTPPPATAPIPVREVTTPIATDSGVLRSTAHVRALSDGRVMVNDVSRRRLILFDSTLKAFTVLADTAAGAPNKYPAQTGGLIAYVADSTILVDVQAQALIVIDPAGRFGRVMAPPKPSDLRFLTSTFYGVPGFDAKGRLIYRGVRLQPPGSSSAQSFQPDGANKLVISPMRADSAPILRSDFDTRGVDTIALMRIQNQQSATISPRPGAMSLLIVQNPVPVTDEWALLPDGTVAIVRAQDYHVDWWTPDDKLTSTPKMPFDWKRITSEEKEALLDSLKRADSTRRANAPPAPPPSPGAPVGLVQRPPLMTVAAADLPDYYPPIRQGQVKASPDGMLWILPSTSTLSQGSVLGPLTNSTSGLAFDVVNRKGEIVERVKLPPGRNLAGFGPGGVIYMIYAPAPGQIYLERTRIVR